LYVSFSTSDTIVAIATPAGRGGIGVVRVSGPEAAKIATALTGQASLAPRHATLARVGGADAPDRAIVTSFPAPASYTGEDVVEISAHGSPVLLNAIIRSALDAGARLAEPGEFTLRAYLNGRMDLVQAEAVADLIAAVTPLQARTAFDQLEGTLTDRIGEIDAALFDLSARLEASLDFPGEGYHFVEPSCAAFEVRGLIGLVDALLDQASVGRLVREGAQVVILGRPNAGKSTLFNALAGAGRAIVTDIPGTTRDLLTETVDIDGIAVTLIDTAGIRHNPTDPVECEGIARAKVAAARADLSIVVLDRSRPLESDDRALLESTARASRVVVSSKVDLEPAWADNGLDSIAVQVSAPAGRGIDVVRSRIREALGISENYRDTPAITNIRHMELLTRARTALERACRTSEVGLPEELVASDLAEARAHLEEITGHRTPEDTLRAIFDRFCIGK
jgi:tRNA modification GTPase